MFYRLLLLVLVIILISQNLNGVNGGSGPIQKGVISIREEMMLTDEQQTDFDKFKAKAVPMMPVEYMKQDIILMKYFKASQMNGNKAMELWTDNLKFRLEHDNYDMEQEEVAKQEARMPVSILQDKMGRVVVYIPVRLWDLLALSSDADPETAKKVSIFTFNRIESVYKKSVSNLETRKAVGVVMILDMHGVEPNQMNCMKCVEIGKETFPQLEMKWPGAVQSGYAINTNPMFAPVFNMWLSLISTRLREKVELYGVDDKEWIPVLTKILDEDKFPPELYKKSADPADSGTVPMNPMNPMAAAAGYPNNFMMGAAPGGAIGGGQGGRGMGKKKGGKQGRDKKNKKKHQDDDDDDADEE